MRDEKRPLKLNIIVSISVALLVSFLIAFSIMGSYIHKLSQNSIKYYSTLVGESLNNSIAFSRKIDENQNILLYYVCNDILDVLKNIKLDDISTDMLNYLTEKHGLDGISILKPTGLYAEIEHSTHAYEIGETTKDWGYWNDALVELYKNKKVTSVEGGFAKDSFWAGPKTYSFAEFAKLNRRNFYKYAYIYNEQGYIISPFVGEDNYSYKADNL